MKLWPPIFWMAVNEFIGRMAQREADLRSLSPGQARRAAEAVLETQAQQISEGEAEDVIARLPVDLTPALERGLADHRRVMRMSLDEFLAHVARREGADRDQAEGHARAVFAALREVMPRKPTHDTESEFPREYAPLSAW